MPAGPRISAVVVSYRVRELLRRCLASLETQRGVVLEIWVVDNASGDGSPELVEREFPAIHLIRNAENVGFARANNQAMERAEGELIALINPDTELPPDALAIAAQVFGRNSRAGAVGLALLDDARSPQPACHRFPGLLNLIVEAAGLRHIALRLGIGTPTEAPVPRGGEGRVDWVAGACMILRRKAYRAVGGLNPDLFMYGEEMDWSWRARKLGFDTVFSSAALVIHHGGASGEGLRGELFVRNLEARLQFLRRFRGSWRADIAREIMTAGSALRMVLWRLRERLERSRGAVRPQTHDQLERFRAVMAWRRRGRG